MALSVLQSRYGNYPLLSLSLNSSVFESSTKKQPPEADAGKLALRGAKKRLGGTITRREGDTKQRQHYKALFSVGSFTW